MYFTVSEIKRDLGAQYAVLAAHIAGEKILGGDLSSDESGALSGALEAAVMHVSRKTNMDPATVATQLLNQDAPHRRKVLEVGFAEINRAFGGKENALAYFRQIDAPRAKLRFESVGGLQHDILEAKNRAAVLAMKAQGERFMKPKHAGLLPMEREVVDFMKSVRRSVEDAVNSNRINALAGIEVVDEIQKSVEFDKRPINKEKLEMLNFTAMSELYDEKRASVMAQYKKPDMPAPRKNAPSNDGPTMN